jgi:Zn-dependent protease with chaperone function
MISALQKISQDPVIESIEKDTVAAMCIQTPFAGKTKFKSRLSTHPSIEDRIKALQSY